MNVTLTPALETFVRQKVKAGDFRSAVEVVSEGLRLLQQQEQWASEARARIDEGWRQAKSGQLSGPKAVRQNLAGRKKAWKGRRSPA